MIDLVSLETPSAKSQTSMSKWKESNTTEATTRDRSRVSMFITEKEATGFSLGEDEVHKEGTMS